MDSSTRSAHRRVGAAAVAAFLALLLLGLNRGPASANQAAPAATPTPERSQPAPDFNRERPRRGFRGGDPGFGPGGGADPGPGIPATPNDPSSGLNTT
jgi:hypothetical protein